VAEYSLGQELQARDPDRAIPHLRRTIEITEEALRANPAAGKPEIYVQSHVAIGTALLTKARAAADPRMKLQFIADARNAYATALRLDPKAPHAQRNLEIADQMRAQLTPRGNDTAWQLDVLLNAGTNAAAENDMNTALARYRQAVDLAPQSVEARVYLALGLGKVGRNVDAAEQLRAAQRLDAKAANEFVTRAMQLPPSEENLRDLIASLTRQP